MTPEARLALLAIGRQFLNAAAVLKVEIERLSAECERLRAVAKAASWVTPYIPEIGEETYCHPMHRGYHNGQFHTVYVTKREQEQFGRWSEDFTDALAALDEEATDE